VSCAHGSLRMGAACDLVHGRERHEGHERGEEAAWFPL
jgi:hypothetical protein